MDKWNYSIDLNWYNLKEEDSFFVEGWLVYTEEAAKLAVCDDCGRLLESRVCRKERPDIRQARPELSQASEAGFLLQVPKVSSWISGIRYLEILAVCGEERKSLGRLAVKEIRKSIADSTIQYKIDIQQYLGTELELQGWFVDQCGRNKIQVLDEKNREVSCTIRRSFRQDVQDQYAQYLSKDTKTGFLIKVSRKDIRTRHVKICFVSRQARKEYLVDIRQMERNLTRSGRLCNALSPSKLQDNLTYIRREGMGDFVKQVKNSVFLGFAPYSMWVKRQRPGREEVRSQQETVFVYQPKISIVIPLYETSTKYLKIILDSIVTQSYENWELCLADGSPKDTLGRYIASHYGKDSRIRYRHLEENGGISVNTNAAVSMASGDYIMLSDHDDIVEQGALYEIVKALNTEPRPDIVYTDEDKITMDGKDYFEPNFKTDFNPFMLESNNYICHIFVVKREIMEQIGGFRPEFDGAQDFDLILRCWEATEDGKIYHIPKVLYHWRSHPNSTATNPESKRYAYEAGAKALNEHFERIGVEASAEITQNLGFYRIHREVKDTPLVSIIIPNKDHREDLEKCLSSIVNKSTWENYEILVAENNSTEPETFVYYEEMQKKYPRCRLITWKAGFNYAAINNFAAKEAKGEYLLFLNNDVELITENWMEEFLGICQLPQVGAVGAKLYYPDKTIQHAGVIIGMGGVAGHMLSGQAGYVGRSTMPQNLSAVTAACMMMKKEVFEEIKGFDEDFKVAYNDVDLCMKATQAGYQVVYTPYVELYHYESRSRGPEDTEEKRRRLAEEARRFADKWPDILEQGDPYYNVNLSLEDGTCSLRQEAMND